MGVLQIIALLSLQSSNVSMLDGGRHRSLPDRPARALAPPGAVSARVSRFIVSIYQGDEA
ncbi:hypothetical protein [Microvirga splendida]|uniref:Uncharacterized protein n=1 Tax=Microvirga splendida TaxID=2795727 RepID=A0ABS0Y7Q6_9HYPH|nr:hypothetical protein [Microvirga splendida]MBJ6128335.1 hypothetical protein [Microvirga splendida]